MTGAQRKKLHDLLMPGNPPAVPGSFDYRLFEESVTEDILKIEPAIDEMLKEAAEGRKADAIPEHAPST